MLRIGVADENAAVGVVADPELGAELEVLEGLLGDEIGRDGVGVLLIDGDDRAVLDLEGGAAVALPLIEVLAVEQGDPPAAGLAECGAGVLNGRNGGK